MTAMVVGIVCLNVVVYLQVFLVIVWNFELYMLPITLLIVFFKNLLVVHIVGNLMKDKDEDVSNCP